MPKAKEIRAKAREAMAGKWGRFVGMNFLYILITVLIGVICFSPIIGIYVSLIADLFANKLTDAQLPNILSTFASKVFITELLSIVSILIGVPLAYAVLENIMKAKRDNETKATYFFGRIFPSFGRAWKVTLWTFVKLIIPAILYTIGVIISCGIGGLLTTKVSDVLGVLFIAACSIALFIWYISKVLNLILGDYIAIDNPEITAKEAVEKSIELMPGYRWKYICLNLSFIGWAFLSAFTFGIGDLFLDPYIAVSNVVFYEEVVKAHGQTTEKEPVAEAPVVEEQPTQE